MHLIAIEISNLFDEVFVAQNLMPEVELRGHQIFIDGCLGHYHTLLLQLFFV